MLTTNSNGLTFKNIALAILHRGIRVYIRKGDTAEKAEETDVSMKGWLVGLELLVHRDFACGAGGSELFSLEKA